MLYLKESESGRIKAFVFKVVFALAVYIDNSIPTLVKFLSSNVQLCTLDRHDG